MTDRDKIAIMREALDHISDHAPWGGLDYLDHVQWMQKLALNALKDTGEYSD